VVGEAGSARRQARRAGLRVAAAAAAALLGAWGAGCASMGDPPGGPPDTTPPTLLATVPESGAVLGQPPRRIELDFDKVISERIAAQQPTLAGAVLVSPSRTPVSVGWHRDRLTITVKGGFRPERVYRVDLLPVIVDLRQNKMKRGRTIIFSTGPAIPTARLSGSVVDWTGGRVATGALVQAVLLPDSLPYLALTDSVGGFSLGAMPPGDYLVYGVLDQNNNRRRDPREAFDTARVALTDTGTVELYAFTHDTIGPRLKSADPVDSVTVKITFDRPVSPGAAVDTANVHVSPLADSTQTVPLAAVYTTTAFDSVRKAETVARAARDSAARAAKDSAARVEATARAARDSAARAAAAARDTTHRKAAAPAAPAPAQRPVRPPPLGPAAPRDTTQARHDTSRAALMLVRRPAPSDTRVVRFAAPREPGARYAVSSEGVIGLTGVAGRGRTTFTEPKPRPPAPAPARSAADSAARVRADTTGARPDTTGVRRDTTGVRPDTAGVPRDTTGVRRDSTAAPRPGKPR